MTKVIINADDFGINKVVTSEIERMVVMGAISSTTIMANGECLEEVKRFALLHPQISFGIHLCLSEFSSITKSPILFKYGLTDKNGVFIKDAIFGISRFTEELKKALKEELKAQVEIVLALGIPISHIDSHHHVHTVYPLYGIIDEVMRQYGFKKIRLGIRVEPVRMIKDRFFPPKQTNTPDHTVAGESNENEEQRSAIHRLLSLFRATINRYKLNGHLKTLYTTTDGFYSYSTFRQRLEKNELRRKEHIIELMCHPGHPGVNYRNEMKDVENKSVLCKHGIKLISYNDIH